MNRSHVTFIAAISLTTSALFIFASACLQPEHTTKTFGTASATLVGNIALGEGYNSVADQATGEICLAQSGYISETHPTTQPYTAFMIEEYPDLPFEVDRYMRDDVDVADYGNKVDDFYDDFIEARSGQGMFLSMLVSLPTVKRELTAQVVDDPDASCDSNPPADFYEFVSRCGTEYLGAENYGVMILLVADVTDDSLSDRLEYEELLNLNIVGNPTSATAAMSALVNEGHDIEWNVEVLTPNVPQPSSGILSNNRLPSSNWDDYVEEIEDEYINGQGQITNTTYGEVLSQDFEQYKDSTIEDCGDLQPGVELTCYYEASNANARLLHDENLHRQYALVEWVLDNLSRIRFAELENEDASTIYETWLNDYETCRDSTLDSVMDSCHDAMLNEASDLCTPCSIPTTCDPRTFIERAYALPAATIVTKADEATQGDEYAVEPGSPSISTAATQTCVLASFYGNFDTTSDKAVLDWDGSEWSLSQAGNGRGSMYCSDLNRFVDGKTARGGSLDWDIDAYSDTVNSGNDTTDLSDGIYASAVSGAQGDFDGGGEFVQITNNPVGQDSSMLVNSNTGSNFTGHAISFGTPNAPSTGPVWASQPTNTLISWSLDELAADPFTNAVSAAETKLVAIDEGLCFFEKINGRFDGLGETVQLKKRDNFWHLRISSGCAGPEKGFRAGRACGERKDMLAAVRCYRYDQR